MEGRVCQRYPVALLYPPHLPQKRGTPSVSELQLSLFLVMMSNQVRVREMCLSDAEIPRPCRRLTVCHSKYGNDAG